MIFWDKKKCAKQSFGTRNFQQSALGYKYREQRAADFMKKINKGKYRANKE